jgi:TatD DNase family protein
VIERALATGIERLLVPGYDLESSRAAVALARTHPTTIQAAVGIHPHFASSLTADAWQELAALAAAPDVVAVGEIGLDFYRNLSPPEAQRIAFARQLALAATLGKPVLVHDRDAHAAIRDALLAHRSSVSAGRIRGVLHAFSGDAEMASALAAAGYLISFAMPVAFRSAAGPRAAARAIPAGSLLTETDSPWLAPGGKGQRNEPTTALRVASELARLRDVSPEMIATEVRQAYDRLIGR